MQILKFYHFLFLAAVTCISASAATADFPVLFKGTVKWELDPKVEANFNQYLAERTARLTAKVPQLVYPGSFKSFGDGFVTQIVAVSKTYQHREVSCEFLKKIHKNLLSEDDKNEVLQITDNFTLCIPRDVAASERTAWSTRITELLWSKPWIQFGAKKFSLSEYLSNQVKSSMPLETKVIVSEKLEFDGYAYAYSKADLQFAKQTPLLQRIFELSKGFRPDQPDSVNFGPKVADALKNEPYGFGGFLIADPTIIISNSWAPFDLPELLAHEYGHIYHSLLQKKLKLENGVVTVNGERAHQEGVAESFAAQTLCGLYDQYPEIEFLHLAKLHLMSLFRNRDPHYVGAAAFATKFHSLCENDISPLEAFASAESISVYLQRNQDLVPPNPFGIESDFLINFVVP